MCTMNIDNMTDRQTERKRNTIRQKDRKTERQKKLFSLINNSQDSQTADLINDSVPLEMVYHFELFLDR